jgi:Ca2+-binding EF-hand superfamily protein
VAAVDKKQLSNMFQLKEVFNIFDQGSKGFLEISDFKALFGRSKTEEQIAQIIAEADKNKN